jgi:hypothetical protein
VVGDGLNFSQLSWEGNLEAEYLPSVLEAMGWNSTALEVRERKRTIFRKIKIGK